jgi:hypothetical protein
MIAVANQVVAHGLDALLFLGSIPVLLFLTFGVLLSLFGVLKFLWYFAQAIIYRHNVDEYINEKLFKR